MFKKEVLPFLSGDREQQNRYITLTLSARVYGLTDRNVLKHIFSYTIAGVNIARVTMPVVSRDTHDRHTCWFCTHGWHPDLVLYGVSHQGWAVCYNCKTRCARQDDSFLCSVCDTYRLTRNVKLFKKRHREEYHSEVIDRIVSKKKQRVSLL